MEFKDVFTSAISIFIRCLLDVLNVIEHFKNKN